MKTPKPSTPAPKSKLNTPRSGFIQKNTNSGKNIKFNVFESDVTKSSNGTPKVNNITFKGGKNQNINFGSGKKFKPPGIIKNSPQTKEDRQKSSPLPMKKNPEGFQTGLLSEKKPTKKETTPKTGKFHNSPNSKFRQNKASPEVQLGLDIEQFLDKNSSSKNTQSKLLKSTPVRIKKQMKSKPFLDCGSTKKGSQLREKKKSSLKGNQPGPISIKEEESEKGEELVDSVTLTKAVKALIKYIDGNSEVKDGLLEYNMPIFLQINYIKEPPKIVSRLLVPHSLLTDSTDVCLFIADKGKKKDPEDLVDEMKELLKKHGIEYISEIMCWRKANQEHTQYEQKRKLMNRFDYFLIENKLSKIRSGLFSKFSANKNPIPVKLTPDSNLKMNIDKALRKVSVSFRGHGLTVSIVFGHYKMGVQQLVENIDAVLKQLCDETKYLGGRNNIRSVFIRSQKSPNFPLYITTKSRNLVQAPQKGDLVKDEGVEGELSTFPDRVVRVYKDGTVRTKKIKNNEENVSEQQKNAQKKKGVKRKAVKEEEEEDESEEDAHENQVGSDYDIDIEEDVEDDSEEEEDDDDVDDDDDEEEEEEVEMEEDEDIDEDDGDINEEDEEVEVDSKIPLREIKKLQQNKKNKRKQDSSTDEEQLDEAEQHFLKELRKQQDIIEAQGKSKKLQEKLRQKPNKMQEKVKKVQPRKGNLPTDGSTTEKENKVQHFSQGKKTNQHNKVNAALLTKAENNTVVMNKSKGRRRKKNKQGSNSNASPQNKQVPQIKKGPGGKKLKTKS